MDLRCFFLIVSSLFICACSNNKSEPTGERQVENMHDFGSQTIVAQEDPFSKQYDLNKPISDSYNSKELKMILADEDIFEDVYVFVRKIKSVLFNDELIEAKYGDITYQEVLNYFKARSNTEFLQEIDNEYAVIISQYRTRVDSALQSIEEERAEIRRQGMDYVELRFDENNYTDEDIIKACIDSNFKTKNEIIGARMKAMFPKLYSLIEVYCELQFYKNFTMFDDIFNKE